MGRKVTCPECDGEAQIVTNDPDYDNRRALECLNRECLHWEFRD